MNTTDKIVITIFFLIIFAGLTMVIIKEADRVADICTALHE